MKERFFATSATACAFVAGVATSAGATMLETIEQMILEDMPGFEFSYESVISDTDDGFEIAGVRIVEGAGTSGVTIDRLRVSAFDLDAIINDTVPTFMDVEAEDIHIPVETVGSWPVPGGLALDFAWSYEHDEASGRLNLRQLRLGVEGYGTVALGFAASGVSREGLAALSYTGPQALIGATLLSLSITIDDDGGLGVLLALLADEQGMDLPSFVETQVLEPLQRGAEMLADDPIGSPVLTTVLSFVSDYRDPGGPLTISLTPDAPVGFFQIVTAMSGDPDPARVMVLLGLSATYDR